jgi:Secretion system C-terminal sorting domain
MKKLIVLVLSLCVASLAFAIDVDKAAINAAIDALNNGTLTKAQDALLSQYGETGPIIDNAGGPDAFGYIWRDSEEVGGPTYGWIDITGTGTSVIGDMADDNTTGPYPIGFGFPNYGAVYTDFYVGSNGAINFDGQYVSFGNSWMPTGSYGPMIAWFWDDLDPADATDANLLYETMVIGVQNALVISFLNWDEYPGNVDPALQESVTAQMILFEDGTVEIHYQSVELGIDILSCTIGIQDATGSIGLNPLYNGNIVGYPYDSLAIEFTNTAVADASVTGRVLDFDEMQPLLNVAVTVGGTTVFTDINGDYNVTDLYPGTVTVSATAEGYFSYGPVEIEILSGVNTHDFSMYPFPEQTYFTDFEPGSEPFWPILPLGSWEFGTPTIEPNGAYSGVNAWSTVLDGDYGNSEQYLLASGDTGCWEYGYEDYIGYFHYYDYEYGYDGYNILVSGDEGITWELVTPEGGYPDDSIVGLPEGSGFTGTTPGWELVLVNLTAWYDAYDRLMIAFQHGTDSSVNTYSGVSIDDFAMYGPELCPPEPVVLDLTPVVNFIPMGGGNVVYDAHLLSNIGLTMPGLRYQTFVTLPSNQIMGPIDNVPFNLMPFMDVTVSGMTVTIPGYAPMGGYSLEAKAGVPNSPAQQVTDSFQFVKAGNGVNEGFGDEWELWQFGWFYGSGTGVVDNGYYKLDMMPDPVNWGSLVFDAEPFADCVASTTFELVQTTGNSVGLLFRGSGVNDAAYSGYSVYISNGYWSAWRYDAGTPVNLVTWTLDPAIMQGVGAVNQVKTHANGGTFDAFVNNIYVGSFADATYATGYTGFTTCYQTETWFDNLICSHTFAPPVAGPIEIGDLETVLRDHTGNVITDPAEFYTQGVAFDRSAEFANGIEFIRSDWVGNGSFIAGEEGNVVALPTSFSMAKAYPNPFNPSTTVAIALPMASDLTVTVFNIMGQQVATLANGKFNAGQHNFSFDASNLSSGIYFVHAIVPGELNEIQKITLMK